MLDKITTSIVTILTAIVGLAILAVLVSKNAATAAVLTQSGKSLGGIINTAVSPVTMQFTNVTSGIIGQNID